MRYPIQALVLVLLLTGFVQASQRPRKTRIYKTREFQKILTPKPTMTDADEELVNKSKENETYFPDTRAAEFRFRKDFADRLPCMFKEEPAERPSYIPESTLIRGTECKVEFDTGHGGYGSTSDSEWHPYNPLNDPAVLPALMKQEAYVVESDFFDVQLIEQGRQPISILVIVVCIILTSSPRLKPGDSSVTGRCTDCKTVRV